MQINMEVYEGWKRTYTLTLSKLDFDHFTAGCPELDCVQGWHKRVCFQLYNGIRVPDAFQYSSSLEGYFVEIGAEIPIPEAGISPHEFDRLTDIFCENLRNAITKNKFSLLDGMGMNIGNVVMKIED